MRIKSNLLTAGVLLSLIFIAGCVSDSSKSNKDKNVDKIELSENEPLIDEKIFYRFPSPEEIFKYVKTSDLQYDSNAANDSENYKSYLGMQKQALNLGIYISDLSYITMFDQQDESLDYFSAIHSLSEELHIASAFKRPLIDRISDNIDNNDSLVIIASDAYLDIVNYLGETDQEDILAFIASGVLIESLYLTINHITTYDEKSELLEKIINQKYVVSNIFEFAKQQKEVNSELDDVVADIELISNIFTKLKTETKETTVKKTKSKKLIIGGGTKLAINETEFIELKSHINKIREKYTIKQ